MYYSITVCSRLGVSILHRRTARRHKYNIMLKIITIILLHGVLEEAVHDDHDCSTWNINGVCIYIYIKACVEGMFVCVSFFIIFFFFRVY